MLVSLEFGSSVCALQVKHVGHIKHLPFMCWTSVWKQMKDMLSIACLGS